MRWPAGTALLLGVLPAFWLQGWVPPGWRRWMVLGGLPLLMLITAGVSVVGPWGWLGLALALLVLYPLQAWRDAPVFPTPRSALQGLAAELPLPPSAAILDAGSGLGHGMEALRQVFPSARIHGVESSLLLVFLSRWRLPRTLNRDRRSTAALCKVVHGDMWSFPWAAFDLVYVFQRPESMQRAWDKACREMSEGTWLVSLEFEVPGPVPTRRLTCPDGRGLWIYQLVRHRDSIPGPFGR
jgi:SAM-dependent methyltransferase